MPILLPFLLALGLTSQTGPPAATQDIWEAAYFEGTRVGYCQTTTQVLKEGADGRLRITIALDLSLRRSNAQVRLRVEHATEETPDGKVVGLLVRHLHDNAVQLRLVGTLEENTMRVVADGGRPERRLRWSDDVIGLGRRDQVLAEHKPKAGERFAYQTYEPLVNTVVTVRVLARGPEEVALPTGKRSLLRVELTPDKLESGTTSLQLPSTIVWLDEDFHVVRRQFELDGLGSMVLVPSTKEAATAPVTAVPRSADISLRALVPLSRPLPNPARARSATYRITLRGDADAATAFVADAHQEVRAGKGDTFELIVHPVRPDPAARGGAAPAEFLGSSRYIDTEDARIRDLAAKAVAGENDPWRQAQRLERWVRSSLKVDNAAPLAPASSVARDLRGDCRHAALLTTALCRASGLPARTAIGLVYVEKDKKPYLGFHMWTEVQIAGQWLGLDSTPGIGPVGVGHLKVTDHSWDGVTSLTPLLPLQRVVGKAAIEIVKVEGGE